MIIRWTRRAESAFERPWRRVVAVATGMLLIGVASVPNASAGLVGDVAGTVGTTVKSVQAAPNAVPSLPSTTPPATPSPPPPQSPPAATPASPSQAAVELPTVKLPSGESSPQSRAGKDGSTGLPSPNGVTGGPRSAADPVAAIDSDAVAGSAPQVRDRDGSAAAPRAPNTDASPAVARGDGAGPRPPVAVRAAEVAALQRWLARVWPAVALGGSGIDGAGVVEVIARELFRPALAAITGVLLASSPVLSASGDAPLAGHQGVASASRSAPAPLVPVAGDGGGIIYLIAIAGLLALLAFTVWREFRMALHPDLR